MVWFSTAGDTRVDENLVIKYYVLVGIIVIKNIIFKLH